MANADETPSESETADFLAGYLDAAQWVGAIDESGETVCDIGAENLPADFRTQAAEDCASFLASNLADVRAYVEAGRTLEMAGHDFYLTRNHHGAGFWDRGAGAVGDRLTEMAHPWGDHLAFL